MNASVDGSWTADSGMTVDTPPEPKFSAAQYSQAARALLPPGRAWNRNDGSNQASFCDAIGNVYAQQDSDCLEMLEAFFPSTATEGLDEWNSTLGIPDACSGAPSDQTANQQQIAAKLAATGGQSVQYYIDLASSLGYDVTITEFSPTHVGNDAPAGLIVQTADWAHTWRVNVLNSPAPDTTLLNCMLERYKPAHTQFYIVNGTATSTYSRLFNVSDNVADGLLVQV